MSSTMAGHARPRLFWESLRGTMSENSWDSLIQGSVYSNLPHALGYVRFVASKTKWVKAYKEVHTCWVAISFVDARHMVDDGWWYIKERSVFERLIRGQQSKTSPKKVSSTKLVFLRFNNEPFHLPVSVVVIRNHVTDASGKSSQVETMTSQHAWATY